MISVRERCIAHLVKAHQWDAKCDTFPSSDSQESSSSFDTQVDTDTLDEDENTIDDEFILMILRDMHEHIRRFDDSVFNQFN